VNGSLFAAAATVDRKYMVNIHAIAKEQDFSQRAQLQLLNGEVI
jgi:hypothetical protein